MEKLLHVEDSFVLVEEGGLTSLVIGAPHHAPEGVETLPCPTHGNADENTGQLARYLAQRLNASCVVVTNARIDPNKDLETEYSKAIRTWNPRLLIEIHGHGGKNAHYDVEISPGREEREHWSRSLATLLMDRLSNDAQLKSHTVSGAWNDIYFKASQTATVNGTSWIALHIELLPELRKAGRPGSAPPAAGYRFCEALALAIVDVLVNVATEIPAPVAAGGDQSSGAAAL